MKKTLQLIVAAVLLYSCQLFDKKVPDENQLLQQELQKINWEEVDELPSVLSCDTIKDPAVKKQCFFDYLTQLIQQKLSVDTLSVLYPQLDTIDVKVTISPDATMVFEPQITDTLSYNTTKIDSILKARLVDFPAVHPAIKRGIPVKTQFVLPVLLNITEKK